MVEFAADDAQGPGREEARDRKVEQILICTLDKNLAQCVVGTWVVQFDRRRSIVRDEAGVVEKLGMRPKFEAWSGTM